MMYIAYSFNLLPSDRLDAPIYVELVSGLPYGFFYVRSFQLDKFSFSIDFPYTHDTHIRSPMFLNAAYFT